MSVQVKTTTSVIQTPCVPILKGRMFVVVQGDTLVTVEDAQVNTLFFCITENLIYFLFSFLFKILSIYFPNLDFDECASLQSNDCDPSSLCTNTEGSYVCRCIKGFEGDGKNCTGKNWSWNCLSFVGTVCKIVSLLFRYQGLRQGSNQGLFHLSWLFSIFWSNGMRLSCYWL